MTTVDEVRAIRESVGLSRLDHVCYLRLTGPRAHEVLDRVIAGTLRVRDGQMRHALLLTEDAFPFADAYVGRDDEDLFLLADGADAATLIDHIRRHAPAGAAFDIENRSESHAILALDGPYAWELLGAAIDPEVIGLPYLTFYHREGMLCYRAGKTGEFGYGLVVPREQVAAVEARVRAAGEAFDLRAVSLGALDHCALENFFFNIRREGRERVTPIELQLQWRVSYQKECVGAEALSRRRTEGPTQRLSCLLADGELAPGDTVEADGATIGRAVSAGFSAARDAWVSLALLDVAWAHPGIDDLTVRTASGAAVRARVASPPILLNRSLLVSPQLHSYATRHEAPHPPHRP